MAHKIIHDSKHVFKRVVIGVLTGIVGFSIVYFLGFNKPPYRPSEAEIRENTIKTWKTYIELENTTAVKRDSLYKRLSRLSINLNVYRDQDSVIRDDFISGLEKFKATKSIDKLLYLLLDARIRYRMIAWSDYLYFHSRRIAIQDSVGVDSTTRNYLFQELNVYFANKNNNFTERLGHTIEDMAIALAKRYKYPFSIADLKNFNPYYQNLKKMAIKESVNLLRPETAPVEPGQSSGH